MTDEQFDTIIERLSAGIAFRVACKELGIDHGTARSWVNAASRAEHRARIKQARDLGCDALAEECIEIADSNLDPKDKRVRIDTRLRVIGKWNAANYGDKVTVEGRQTVTHKYDLDGLSDAQLDELEQILTIAQRCEGSESPPISPRVH